MTSSWSGSIFIQLGDIWVETSALTAFWPAAEGSMLLVDGVALPCSVTPEEVFEKLKQALHRPLDPF